LPALAGLAAFYGERLTKKLPVLARLTNNSRLPKNVYIAGVWASALPEQLLWRRSGRNPSPNEHIETSIANSIPTWSWASVEGPVVFQRCEITAACKFLGVGKGRSHEMQRPIIMQGPLKKMASIRHESHGQYDGLCLFETYNPWFTLPDKLITFLDKFPCPIDETGSSSTSKELLNVYFFWIGHNSGLILLSCSRLREPGIRSKLFVPGAYKRVGMFCGYNCVIAKGAIRVIELV